MGKPSFEWDEAKNQENEENHGASFYETQHAFLVDKNRIIAKDTTHRQDETRYYCFGLNEDNNGVLTVCFTYRSDRIRIIGAG